MVMLESLSCYVLDMLESLSSHVLDKLDSVIELIIIHKFSIALFPTERAQRACSHTCT